MADIRNFLLFALIACLCLGLKMLLNVWISGGTLEAELKSWTRNPLLLVLAAILGILAARYGWISRVAGLTAMLAVLLVLPTMASRTVGLALVSFGCVAVVANVAAYWIRGDCGLLEYLSFADCRFSRYLKLGLGYGLVIYGLICLVRDLIEGPEESAPDLKPHTPMSDPAHEIVLKSKPTD